MNNREPAFPSPAQNYPNGNLDPPEYGMSFRDNIAIQAMNGYCASMPPSCDIVPSMVAGFAYLIADEMLKARNE